jgi:hypothetical protein
MRKQSSRLLYASKKQKKILLVDFLLDSWWVFVFLIFCSALYMQGINQVDKEYQKLLRTSLELHSKKTCLLEMQDDLSLQIASQDDYDWIELTLMRKLSVTPEKARKIYFK